MIRHRVKATGVELAAAERGDRARPTVLLLHGYPDTQQVWNPVADRLAADFHVLTYDVRGAGASSAPRHQAAYDLDRLADDTAAVVEALAPGDRPVHLVGHDWGSMQAWHVAVTQRLGGRLASLTSLGAPCLDHVGHWVRACVRRGRLGPVAGQLARSWYMAMLSIPGAPTLVWNVVGPRWATMLHRIERVAPADDHPAPSITADGIHGANLYRRNVQRRVRRPHPAPRVDVPVQLVLCARDRFVSPRLFDGIDAWVPDLTRTSIDAGHWVIRTHPDEVAGHVASWVEDVSCAA